MNLTGFVKKKVYVKLFSGKIYTGVCQSVDYVGKDFDDVEMYLFTMIERDGLFVAFSNKEIKYVEEQKCLE